MIEISAIPKEVRNKLIKKNFNGGEFISYGSNGKVGLLLKGEVIAVRYQEDQRAIFPKVLRAGDLIGISFLLLDSDLDFELEARTNVTILEIPEDLLNKYILSDLSVQVDQLKKINSYLLQSTRGFFIRIHGGTKAYFAYVLYIVSECEEVIYLRRYTELSNVIFSNKTMFYRLIKEFKEKGIIEKTKNTLVVKNRKLLEPYFEEYIYKS